MGEFLDYFKDKKNILNVLIFAILIMVLPLGVNYVRRQQIIKSRAAGEPIVFTGANIDQRNGIFVAVKPQISLDITAPLPPTGSKSSTKTANSLVGTVYAYEVSGQFCDNGHLVGDTWPECQGCNEGVVTCNGGNNYSFQSVTNPSANCGSSCVAAPTCDCVNGYWQGSLCDSWQSGSCGTCTPTISCATAIAGTRCDELAYDNCSNFCGKGTQGCSTTTQPPPPTTTNDSWCTNGNHVCGTIGADLGSCTLNGQSCRRYETYQCTTSTGVNYCGSSPNQDCRNCTTSPGTQPGASTTTPKGSAGTYTGTGWYGCSAWTSDNCPDKTRTCTTADGKAGVLCHITCTACGTVGSEWLKKGACGGPTTSNPYCDPAGSGNMIGGTCTWEACTAANAVTGGTCTLTPPDITSACTNCILKVKNQGGGDLVNAVKGFDHTRFDPCSAESITSYWCDSLSAGATSECNSIKSGSCAAACTGSGSAPAPSSGTGGPAPSSGAGGPAPTSGSGGPAPSSSGGGSNPNPPPPPVTTVSFRLADNPSDLATAADRPYIADPTPVDFEFQDKNPGQKFVWVEFKFSDGTTERHNKQIKLLGPDPQVVSCALSFEGDNTILNLTGQNFGSQKGIINSNDTNLQVKDWKNNSIKAVWPNAPEGEQLPVALTNPDQQKGEGQCSAISRLALGAKVFCRAPSNHNTNNVDLVLAGAFADGTKARQKVSIDNGGVIQGLTQKLEEGKQYNLSIKAPDGIRKTITFTAGSGTTNIPNFILPIGDIFPADGGDGAINSLDKAELNRQWIIAVSSQRTGDFNQDGRVNSIDWACMRFDFGVSNDPEAVAGAPTTVDVTAPALTNTDTTTNTSSSSSPNPSATSTTSPNPSASSDQTSTQTSTQSLIVSPVPTATSTINSPSKGKGKNKFFLQ